MSLRCRLGKHSALPSNIWNRGFYFSRCSRCSEEMICRPGQDWQVVPTGYRVVWRERTARDVVWSTPRQVGKPLSLTELLDRHTCDPKDTTLPWKQEASAEERRERMRIVNPAPILTRARHLSA